ncbi:MAG TPA: peptidase A24 [Firmicutes bacterium]|nr:peptidase A24 [Bacillota bacterium]
MTIQGGLALLAIVGAVYIDVWSGKIPNALVALGFLSGFVLNSVEAGLGGLLLSLEGAFLGLALLFIPFALGGMGAGDVKLLGAIGALIGPQGVFYTALYGALAGGVMAVVVLIKHRRLFVTLRTLGFGFLLFLLGAWGGRSWNLGQSKGGSGSIGFPYSLAIGAGLVLALILRRAG